MINKFLQFIKKQRLAIRLARTDSLFVISGLRTFRYERPLARLFRCRLPYSPLVRFQKFLQLENNPLLNALYEEFACRTDFLPFASYLLPGDSQKLQGEVCFRNTNGFKEKEFIQVADWIVDVMDSLVNGTSEIVIPQIREKVIALCNQFPIYKDL